MKKLFLLSALLIGFTTIASAQDIADNAIGLRIGDSDGFGTEITYQRALGGNNRLEVDLGWRNYYKEDGFKLAGIYQWVWPLEDRINWYAGAGGGLGSAGETFLFAAGDIGIEYDFDIPLLISLDFRPEINFGDALNDNLGFDIALSLRYQF
ncbi:hypothetical protein [uncultured Winogradskyella sp.]|uniref:hypothetical protein n=1 Tax=uncultured Winogradskyella sp. TaxID=395353 RepID=UPI0026046331|nr:hypothetical protein [uncultured Winogradskyella sp.]|tara:strand:+ start:5406 stop:5861 length:456 start_codon:yes stop_codon:yes gene_type:complete